ncbi:hypothetical protein MF622_09960 [Paenibacillus polymyxa]|nr:hypothetical protein [Paenibacillus polymyxa]WDZ54870.1 hypothetical protein MF622_09960 [Paenibacillus polymyxa]
MQDLELIPSAITKDKPCCGEGTQRKLFLNNGRQAVNGFTHVCGATGQIDL